MSVDFARERVRAKDVLQFMDLWSKYWLPDGSDWVQWENDVINLIRRVDGADSQREKDFRKVIILRLPPRQSGDNARYRQRLEANFREMLPNARGFLDALMRDLEARSSSKPLSTQRPKIFIAHGGQPLALPKLKGFLEALGCDPIIAEEQPSQGRSVNEQVDWCLDRSDCAIVLATAEHASEGKLYARPNVHIEAGRFQERFPGKTIYLLEEGAKFPSNVTEKVWERFTQDNMERAFLKVVRELKSFGYFGAEVSR